MIVWGSNPLGFPRHLGENMSAKITAVLTNSSAVDDAAHASLGDARRTKRLKLIISGLGMRSDASLPEALETEAEREGYDRFVASDHVNFQPLFAFHADATARRAEAVEAEEILVLHDTSEIARKIWDGEPSRAYLPVRPRGHRGSRFIWRWQWCVSTMP